MRVRRDQPDTAELDQLSNQMRIERLADRLATCGPLGVRHSRRSRSGTRLRLALDDGATLRLRLFHPHGAAVAALRAMRWDDDIGWVVAVTTTAGEHRLEFAFLAELATTA